MAFSTRGYPTRTISRLLGPSLVAMTLAEAYNTDVFAQNTPPVIFFNGNILFVVGLAIVQSHNYWALKPPVLVTLLGWGALVLGLSRMFFPTAPPKLEMDNAWQTYIGLGVLSLTGVLITLMGYI